MESKEKKKVECEKGGGETESNSSAVDKENNKGPPSNSFLNFIYRVGQIIFLTIALPLLIGYVLNLALGKYDDMYRFPSYQEAMDSLSVDVYDSLFNTTYTMYARCTNPPHPINSLAKTLFLMEGDINSFVWSFPGEIRENLRVCTYSRADRPVNKMERVSLGKRTADRMEIDTDEFLKLHYKEVLPQIVTHVKGLMRDVEEVKLVGHGFGANLLLHANVENEVILVNPLDISKLPQTRRYYKKLLQIGLFFSISGLSRALVHVNMDITRLFGINPTDLLAVSSLYTDFHWDSYKKQVFTKQIMWEASLKEIDALTQFEDFDFDLKGRENVRVILSENLLGGNAVGVEWRDVVEDLKKEIDVTVVPGADHYDVMEKLVDYLK